MYIYIYICTYVYACDANADRTSGRLSSPRPPWSAAARAPGAAALLLLLLLSLLLQLLLSLKLSLVLLRLSLSVLLLLLLLLLHIISNTIYIITNTCMYLVVILRIIYSISIYRLISSAVNARIHLQERLVLPRLSDVISATLDLMETGYDAEHFITVTITTISGPG